MIDEKILIEKIRNNSQKVGNGITEIFFKGGYQLAHADIIEIIRSMQTETKPEVKHAKWETVWELTGLFQNIAECSNCGYRTFNGNEKKCPHCKAIMDGRTETIGNQKNS